METSDISLEIGTESRGEFSEVSCFAGETEMEMLVDVLVEIADSAGSAAAGCHH